MTRVNAAGLAFVSVTLFLGLFAWAVGVDLTAMGMVKQIILVLLFTFVLVMNYRSLRKT